MEKICFIKKQQLINKSFTLEWEPTTNLPVCLFFLTPPPLTQAVLPLFCPNPLKNL